MRRILFKALIICCAAAGYVASPFYTAWAIREAVRNGDAAYLQTAIDWPGVRETLKPSLSLLAAEAPDPRLAPSAKPGMWQRLKSYFAKGAMQRAMDSYLTPEGLPRLFQMRQAYRDYVSGEPDESKLPVGVRLKRAWSRVKRAEFTSLTTFEVDMSDKWNETRMYLGKLELTGFGWQLKELRVKMLTTASGVSNGVQQVAATVPPAFKQLSNGFVTSAQAAEFVPHAQRPSFWARAKTAAKTKWHDAF